MQGWINYYGRYYRSELRPLLRRINAYLVRWAQRKYKRLKQRQHRAWQFLSGVGRREPSAVCTLAGGLRPEAG